ncbi:ribonucleoside-diphosphate reductase large subunit [Faustovirus]|nr:ribonucleoside-diphosphate reductase large subunit [Faustovirus]AMN84460.1 hypothetical protein D6_00049 [Faustovirus]AMP44398.1 hypothetical protein PRJ_Dakar_00447 [Faustovirus]
MNDIQWKRAVLYPYKCEKGAQMYKIGITGFINRLRIKGIPHARLYVDDVILQDILGDTIIDMSMYMQCIYKELKVHAMFPEIRDASTSILKQCGNSRLDQSDKKLISVNNITVDSLMTLSRYDRKFNSINATKCNLSILNDDTTDNSLSHDKDPNICVEYTVYQEPNGVYNVDNKTPKYTRDIIDVMQFDSGLLDSTPRATKLEISAWGEVCCVIL